MADAVVEEICKAGGQAAANYDSVATTEGAEGIIRTAVEQFGRIDILVNNAGILRDKTIVNMTDDMWDVVLAVHLRGTWACTRAAARVMKEKGTGGRIVNTTSIAGLKGNFGQANYSAAKAGIYGLTLTSAMELRKDGVSVNAVAPIAKTRMTEDIESVSEEMKPEDVSPVVVFLASDLAQEVTGRIFGVHGRHLFEYAMHTSDGKKKETAWTPAEIDAWLKSPTPTAPAKADAPKGGDAEKVAMLFQLLPAGFDAEKAAGWDVALHFAIPGAGDWTIEVKDQKCRVTAEKPAAPTCVITVDLATMVGMIEGKVNGQTAFLSGKLKATKIPDLAKFGKVFDFKKVQAAAPAAPAKPAVAETPAPKPSADVLSVLKRLPSQFLPDKAAGFNATFLVKSDGAEATVEIKDKTCAVKAGTHPSPTCTFSADAVTLAGILEGTVDAQKAFGEGKVKITHPPSWLKFRQMFQFAKESGLRRSLVGKRYHGGAFLVRPERVVAYDEAVGDKGSLIFPVSLIKDLFMKLVSDPEFNGDLARMVHGEQLMVFRAPIAAWDVLSPRGEVLSIEDKSSGQILNLGQKLYREGEPIVEMETRLFFRGESKGEKSAPPPAPSRGPASATDSVAIPADLPKRYAVASGDDNPIHVDPAFAKGVGFKDAILQGLCTMAIAARALPKDLERISVRFAKPVYPGDTLTTSVWKNGNALSFETLNQAGERMLADGAAVVRG